MNDPAPGQRSQTRGFLFADLRGYSAFTEQHGDAAARDLLHRYRTAVREVIGRFGGAEIRTEGDSFYVVFMSVSEAVQAGLAVLQAADAAASEPGAHPIRVGIGVHAGETVDSAEGIVSSAVNTAARICSAAGAGELLVSDTVRALTRTNLDVAFVPRGRHRLKGIAEPVSLYSVQPVGSSPQPKRSPVAVLAGRWRSRAGLVAGLVLLVVITTVIGAAFLREGLGGAAPPASGPLRSGPLAGNTPSVGAGAVPAAGVIAFNRTALDTYETQLHTIRSDGTGETQLTRADGFISPLFPIWRPDGELLAFGQNVEVEGSEQAAFELFTMNPDGTGVRQMTRSGQVVAVDPAWSPDGAAIAVTLQEMGEASQGLRVPAGQIGIVDVASGEVSPVPLQADGYARDPSWSPDGSRLLCVLDAATLLPGGFAEPGKNELWVVDRDSGAGRAIFSVEANSVLLTPTWSPAGDDIAFAIESSAGRSDIYVVNTEGTGVRQLTDHPANDTEPAWSPDGTWIAFVSDRDFHAELYVMTSEGTSVTRLTETEEEFLHAAPSWGSP